jgi:hypothetical protein
MGGREYAKQLTLRIGGNEITFSPDQIGDGQLLKRVGDLIESVECSECITPTIISPNTTWKLPVRATSTSNLSLSPPPSTVDSVPLADGDRIGLVGQTDATENGIYLRKTLTDWERDADFVDGAVTEAGVEFYTQEGTLNAGKTYLLTTTNADIGTTPLTFVDNVPSAGLDYASAVGNPLGLSTNSGSFVSAFCDVVVPSTGLYFIIFEGEVRAGAGVPATVEMRLGPNNFGANSRINTRQYYHAQTIINRNSPLIATSLYPLTLTGGSTFRTFFRVPGGGTTMTLIRRRTTIIRVA